MSRRTRLIALGTAAALAGCTERTSPDPASEQMVDAPAFAARSAPHAARERLARRFAIALGDPAFRARLKQDLDRSPVRERKLHLQRFLSGGGRSTLQHLARVGREPDAAVDSDLGLATPLEVYFPVPAHRLAWKGGEHILVATAHADGEAPVAFTPAGKRLVLDPARPPRTPVLAVVPVETDFDRSAPGPSFQGGGGGGAGPQPPAGLYLTRSRFTETYEGWLKGAPEFEIHMLGQAGGSDSLTSYACAGEHATGYFHFNQDGLDWSGNVLLMMQTQINSYKSAHPNQNLRIFVIEDDDTSCKIKTDVNRFGALVKAVEAAYPQLTGGRDSTSSNLQKWWKRANSLQKIIKAIASVIVTNDELVGNAVEGAVVGASTPGFNWVVKGDGNKTNGWLNVVMR